MEPVVWWAQNPAWTGRSDRSNASDGTWLKKPYPDKYSLGNCTVSFG